MTLQGLLRTSKLLPLCLIWAAGTEAAAQESDQFFKKDRFEVKVVGKIKKPDIPIIMVRENLNTDYELELKESFLPKIVESVEKKPF